MDELSPNIVYVKIHSFGAHQFRIVYSLCVILGVKLNQHEQENVQSLLI